MESIQAIKQRFGIIGMNPLLDRALEKAVRVATTATVLIFRPLVVMLISKSPSERVGFFIGFIVQGIQHFVG